MEFDFEKKCVHDVYSTIAEHFDNTRYHTWPKIQDFVNSVPSNSTIYDIGCGNGRNMNIRKDCQFIGYDNNLQLLERAKNNNCKCYYGDNLQLPLNDD